MTHEMQNLNKQNQKTSESEKSFEFGMKISNK